VIEINLATKIYVADALFLSGSWASCFKVAYQNANTVLHSARNVQIVWKQLPWRRLCSVR